MSKDELIPHIPHFPNYAQQIADRFDGQERVLNELAKWAKETNALLGSLVEQQRTQAELLERLALKLASQQPPASDL